MGLRCLFTVGLSPLSFRHHLGRLAAASLPTEARVVSVPWRGRLSLGAGDIAEIRLRDRGRCRPATGEVIGRDGSDESGDHRG